MSTQAQGDFPGFQQEHHVTIPSHAAATATERFYIYEAERACRVKQVKVFPAAAATGDNTNRTNINLVKNSTEIGNFDTVTTTGDLTQGGAVTLLSTTTSLAAGDKLYIELEKVASGLLLPSMLAQVVIDFGA